jgi:hypothetical protein
MAGRFEKLPGFQGVKGIELLREVRGGVVMLDKGGSEDNVLLDDGAAHERFRGWRGGSLDVSISSLPDANCTKAERARLEEWSRRQTHLGPRTPDGSLEYVSVMLRACRHGSGSMNVL